MRFLRVFFSLHTIQLIVILALMFAYLAVTARNRVATLPAPEEEKAKMAAVHTESPIEKDHTEKVAPHAIAGGVILETRAGLETKLFIGQVMTKSSVGVKIENLDARPSCPEP